MMRLMAVFLLLISPASVPADVQLSADIGADQGRLVLTQLNDRRATVVIQNETTSQQLTIELADSRIVLTLETGEPDQPDQPDQPDEPDQPDDPDEPDQPDVPEGHLGFTQAAYQWVLATVDLGDDPERAAHARSQAANYASVAAGLIAVPPKWATVSEAFEALRKLNRGVLATDQLRDSWAAFGARIQAKIEPLWPFSRAEAARILVAIGDGLQEVD